MRGHSKVSLAANSHSLFLHFCLIHDVRSALRLAAALPPLANALLVRPAALLPLLDDAARSAQEKLLAAQRDAPPGLAVKSVVRVRIDFHRIAAPQLQPAIGEVGLRNLL